MAAMTRAARALDEHRAVTAATRTVEGCDRDGCPEPGAVRFLAPHDVLGLELVTLCTEHGRANWEALGGSRTADTWWTWVHVFPRADA